MYRGSFSLRKNRERRRLWIADDDCVPVSPECWGQPLIGCNVNAMTQIISGVVIGEWTSEQIPRGKVEPLRTFTFIYRYLYFGSLEKAWEVKTTDVCGIVYKREGIQNPTLTAKTGQTYTIKILFIMNWLFEKMNPVRAHFGQSNFSFFQQKRKQEILLILVIFTYFKVQTKIEKKKMVRKIDHFFIFLILKSASKIQKIL